MFGFFKKTKADSAKNQHQSQVTSKILAVDLDGAILKVNHQGDAHQISVEEYWIPLLLFSDLNYLITSRGIENTFIMSDKQALLINVLDYLAWYTILFKRIITPFEPMQRLLADVANTDSFKDLFAELEAYLVIPEQQNTVFLRGSEGLQKIFRQKLLRPYYQVTYQEFERSYLKKISEIPLQTSVHERRKQLNASFWLDLQIEKFLKNKYRVYFEERNKDKSKQLEYLIIEDFLSQFKDIELIFVDGEKTTLKSCEQEAKYRFSPIYWDQLRPCFSQTKVARSIGLVSRVEDFLYRLYKNLPLLEELPTEDLEQMSADFEDFSYDQEKLNKIMAVLLYLYLRMSEQEEKILWFALNRIRRVMPADTLQFKKMQKLIEEYIIKEEFREILSDLANPLVVSFTGNENYEIQLPIVNFDEDSIANFGNILEKMDLYTKLGIVAMVPPSLKTPIRVLKFNDTNKAHRVLKILNQIRSNLHQEAELPPKIAMNFFQQYSALKATNQAVALTINEGVPYFARFLFGLALPAAGKQLQQ